MLFSDPQINHWGQYTRFTMGKGAGTFNTVNSTTYNNFGQPTNIRTLNTSGTPVTRFNYTFTYNEATGNMLSRRDHITNQSETFQYDHLDRLTQFQVGTSAAQNVSYGSDGNILSKFDAGTYAYEGLFKNAVTSVSVENNSATSTAPSAIPKTAQAIQYTPFDQPATITEGTRVLQISYGADDMRNYSTYQSGATQVYTRYHLGSMDREISGTTVRDVHHIEGPSGTIAIAVKENGLWNYYHTFTDPLGSVVYVFNENGTLNTRQSFDAWGRYRNPTNWNAYTVTNYSRTWLYRGYTGHEMLPAFNLINMNGRLYDPLTARMLSADPIINSIYNTQAYNRFSYVWNNPLKFVDPMGYDGAPAPNNGCCVDCTTNWERIKETLANIFNNSSFTPPNVTINTDNLSSSGIMDAHYRLMIMSSAMGALSNHINSYIHHSNGYGSNYGLGLAGFGYNQTPVSSGGISSSSSPWDYALAMGPPEEEPTGATMKVLPFAITAAAADGPLVPVGDAIGALVLAGAATYDLTQRVYITYTLTNPSTGQIYAGRASGFDSPELILKRRLNGHHMIRLGFTLPKLDKAAQGALAKPAIRGREQQLIDYHGGIGHPKVGNSIRGVSYYNPAGRVFHLYSNTYFGPLAPYTGF